MRGVMTAWDNTARFGLSSTVFQGSMPELYEKWLIDVIKTSGKLRKDKKNILFINAWNEWAEGAHLEPDMKYGYAYLEATANAIRKSRQKV
jgi:hypothetical protein